MGNPTNELAILKREINLVTFASIFGFEVDRKRSTKTSIAMRAGNDKVVISKKGGIWVYFSVFDEQDSGTIIDFVIRRSNKSTKEAIEFLNDWSGLGPVPNSYHRIEESSAEPRRVKAIFDRCRAIKKHAYLESRGICSELLLTPRFKGRVFVDRYNNLAFPHFRNREVCGLELKNKKRGLLVKGSKKTFWRSNTLKADDTIILTESVIDALSYHQLFQTDNAFYFVTGGGISSDQCSLLVELLESVTQIRKVLVATDNDDGGDRIADRVTKAISKSRFEGECLREKPSTQGEDWNDQLRKELGVKA